MTLASSLRPLARSVRGIPGEMGIRPHRVYLVTETWDGDRIGEGLKEQTETEIVEGGGHPPKVRQLNDERLALAGLAQGAIEIGPITADGVSVTADELRGVGLTNKQTLKLRVTGPMGDAWYRIHDVRLDRAIHWRVTAQPLSETPADEP